MPLFTCQQFPLPSLHIPLPASPRTSLQRPLTTATTTSSTACPWPASIASSGGHPRRRPEGYKPAPVPSWGAPLRGPFFFVCISSNVEGLPCCQTPEASGVRHRPFVRRGRLDVTLEVACLGRQTARALSDTRSDSRREAPRSLVAVESADCVDNTCGCFSCLSISAIVRCVSELVYAWARRVFRSIDTHSRRN